MSDERLTTDPATQMPKAVRLDSSGIVLSWKVALGIFAFFITSGAAWTVLGLAKLDDLDAHNKSPTAHSRSHETVYDQMRAQIEPLQTKLDAVDRRTELMQRSYNQDLADRLADRAAEGIRNSARADEVRKMVRDKALYNLGAGKPIRDGIEEKLLH